MKVYLDNAATTPLDPEVFEAMKPFMLEDFGNPSSTHSHGSKVRAAIESSRKKIAELPHCTPGEIIFTSGGTEADNTLIVSGIKTYGIKHAISTPIEHHAVTHTLETLEKQGLIELHHVKMDGKGHVDMNDLENLLKEYPKALGLEPTLLRGLRCRTARTLSLYRVSEAQLEPRGPSAMGVAVEPWQ